jgi:N-acetylglutamate synthase-like GNAT family acetyltransferase
MNIRPAVTDDRVAVLQLTRRLAEQGTPAGRDEQQVAAADAKAIAAAVDSLSPQAQLLVAESDVGVVGFVHVKTVVDYYTQEPVGHVSDLVVAANAQGRGVGRALL